MRVSCSLGSLLSVSEVLECAGMLAGTKAEAIWVPETWGMEAYAMLGAIAARTGQKVGSSIINIYSRSPAAVAMGAATVDAISQGRMLLGLGTSSVPIVESLHGYRMERPLARMAEYVEIIRLALSGKRIDYSGEIFQLRGFELLVRPRRQIPIYVAAVNQGMLDLAWEVADGTILYLRPKSELKETIPRMQKRRKIDVTCQIITCVSSDGGAARLRAKKTLAFYVAVGGIYREFLSKNGFAREAAAIRAEYERSGLGKLHGLVPDPMLESLCIAGTPDEARAQLRGFRDAGVDLPILQFNPVGDAAGSFRDMVGALVR